MQLSFFAPESDWVVKPQAEWPDFKGMKYVGVDTETWDPGLETRGPGFIRGDAHVAGISLASEDGRKIYLPVSHSEGNTDRDAVVRYVRDQLSRPSQKKVGANLLYDLEALSSLGIEPRGELLDVQVAGPLLEEEAPEGFSLNALSKKHLGVGKTTPLLDRALLEFGLTYGTKRNPKPDHGQIAKLPAKYVGPYAEDDAWFPIRILEKQLEGIKEENLGQVFRLECQLLPVLWRMRRRGVRVDLDHTERVAAQLRSEEAELQRRMDHLTGLHVSVSKPRSLEHAFARLGLPIARTKEGNASFNKEVMTALKRRTDLPENGKIFLNLITEQRTTLKLRRDFLEKILHENVKGRIHPQWHPLRHQEDESGGGGTRSGRIASSNVNLTNIPSRDPRLGPLVRGCFVPEHGERWCKNDYSQQEPRIQLHFAYEQGFEGAGEARRKFIDDPSTDYHQMVADLCKERANRDIGRGPAKTINLGLAYGMGIEKLIRQLGVDPQTAQLIFAIYHRAVPYVNAGAKYEMGLAATRGYITTILGRRRHFNYWEPIWQQHNSIVPIYGFDTAEGYWGEGKVRRAGTHKALNAKVQGSAADQTKTAIVELDREGLLPLIQVYDELNHSISEEGQAHQIAEVMREAIPMSVPFKVDPSIANNWGMAK